MLGAADCGGETVSLVPGLLEETEERTSDLVLHGRSVTCLISYQESFGSFIMAYDRL